MRSQEDLAPYLPEGHKGAVVCADCMHGACTGDLSSFDASSKAEDRTTHLERWMTEQANASGTGGFFPRYRVQVEPESPFTGDMCPGCDSVQKVAYVISWEYFQ